MVQVQLNMAKRDFANGVAGNEAIVRRKEVDEGVKMVCSVEATVVQVVVEMVMKFCGGDGFFWCLLVKEVEEDGVSCLEMVKEMEEKKVEELVMEKWRW